MVIRPSVEPIFQAPWSEQAVGTVQGNEHLAIGNEADQPALGGTADHAAAGGTANRAAVGGGSDSLRALPR